MHKKGFETVSGEYQLVYAHFNGGRYTVVRTEAALLAEVAAAANASNWCA
jgi:hypothetical protein